MTKLTNNPLENSSRSIAPITNLNSLRYAIQSPQLAYISKRCHGSDNLNCGED